MSDSSRARLARIVREPGCDLAEAALLCCVEIEPDLDVDAELLRLDAFADGLRATGHMPGEARADAEALAAHLAGNLGFDGDRERYHDPRNGLLTAVLDRKRGLPIALAIVYVSVARRAGIAAFGINTPGHFLVGVTSQRRATGATVVHPVVVDPFHGGTLLTEAQVSERLQAVTGGTGHVSPSMLRPAPCPVVVRRLLDNLTRDFLGQGDVEDALWTVELKLLLPESSPHDLRMAGELLVQLGRYRMAAEILEDYVMREGGQGEDIEAITRLALRARAQMN
ncbi:MAG: SirB1 family protein [Nitriliruptorales bacterium]